jgi:hypothetical protein
MPANRNDTNEQANKAADAGRKATSEAVRAVHSMAGETARAGEHAARAGADVLQRGMETTQEALQSSLKSASAAVERVTDQFTSALMPVGQQSEEVARRSSQNIEAVSGASTILARGVQDASREWFGLVQDRLQKNLDGFKALVHCRSVQDMIAIQSDLMRDTLEQAISTSRRVAELSVRVADEAARRVQAQSPRRSA